MCRKPTYEELEQRVRELEREVVEAKQAGETMRTAETEKKAILDAMSDIVMFQDTNLSIRWGNEAAGRSVGKTQQELVGGYCYELWHGRRKPCKGCPVLSGLETGSPVKRIAMTSDGRWWDVKVEPVRNRNGKIEGAIEIARDITEQKQAEESLRENEERLRQVVLNMPVMLDAFDEDNQILVWNKECERVTGYAAEEMIGASNVLEILYPDQEYLSKFLAEWAERGDEFYNWEMNITCKDGIEKTIAWSNISKHFPIPGWRSWAIGVDISERKQAEAALLEREQKLEQQAQHLEEVNTALKVLLEHREEEKKKLEENILSNVHKLIFPYIEKLESSQLDDKNQIYIDIIKSNLKELISPFADTLSSKYAILTSTEIQVADLIKHGRTSKEIASLLNVSVKAVSFHRGNIRRKLGLAKKKINLRSHLQSLAT
jgi:PAS domain S-box-containing protein